MNGADDTPRPDRAGPVLIELGDLPAIAPADALPVPDLLADGSPPVMARAAQFAARPGSALARWFWGLAGAITTFVLTLAAWDYVTALLARSPVLGGIAAGLIGLFVVVLLVAALRELAAFHRLSRIDAVQRAVTGALVSGDLAAARAAVRQVTALYAGRHELAPARARLAEREAEVMDADGLIMLAEGAFMTPLDAAARAEVEAAARQVATVTAVVPLALADVATALAANLRMIRRVAEIYGGRAGTFGSWRLTKTVMAHLVATGAVAVGDDLISSVAGGSVLSKISRRFGEGIVNGALTARVGVAAMEVCRPLPFRDGQRPSVTGLVRRALTGLFPGAGRGAVD